MAQCKSCGGDCKKSGCERSDRDHPLMIAARISAVARTMMEIGIDMEYYGGFSHWAQRGKEMFGAGLMAREWAQEIKNEVLEKESRAQKV